MSAIPSLEAEEGRALLDRRLLSTLGLRTAVDARGVALATIAIVSFLFMLHWAQRFFIPLMLGIFIAYAFSPLVLWLERLRIPRAIGASIVMAALLGGTGLLVTVVSGEVQAIIDKLPAASARLSGALVKMNRDGQTTAIQKVQAAATQIEKATSQAAGIAPPPKPSAAPAAAPPAFSLRDFLLASSQSVLAFLAQAATVSFLVFFLLLSGPTFKRKLVRLTGPSLSQKKITVKILDEINISVQRYMLMLLASNLLLSALTWAALRWIGLENAGAWAVAAGLLHLIPYIGPAVLAAAVGLAGFLQFDSLSMALLVSGVSLAIAAVVGMLVATWMTGKLARMNTAAVFIALLFWGWLWGIWGMLLSVPIMVVLKVVSQQVEDLQPLAELLAD